MTPEFYDILNKGKYDPSFNVLVNEFAKATGQSKDSISKYFAELSDNVKGVVSPNQSTPTRTTQAEHSRKWKDIPHAIKIGKDIVPLVEYKPFEYARRLAETGASRIGVAKVFGQEIDNTSIVNQLKRTNSFRGRKSNSFSSSNKGSKWNSCRGTCFVCWNGIKSNKSL